MLIQLLSFKYDVCHKEFDPKSAAATWNETSSCLLPSHLAAHVVNCACILHHLWTFEGIARTYMKTLAYTTGTTSKHQRAMWPELYPKSIVFLRIVAWHMSVLSLAQCLRLRCRMLQRYQKRSKKHISNSNFETSSLPDVMAKKPIRNMYFMYVDIAWFPSLSRLEQNTLHSTVWHVHKICPMSMCWRPSDLHEKNAFFAFPSRNAILLTEISDFC